MNASFAVSILSLTLVAGLSGQASNETLLCNNWAFGNVVVADRAAYVAHMQALMTAAGRAQGLSNAQLNALLQQATQVNESDIAFSLQDSSMIFRDDHSVSVEMLAPNRASMIRAAASWNLRDNVLTLTIKGTSPGAPDQSQAFELVSVTKSQLVLRNHGLVQTYIAAK